MSDNKECENPKPRSADWLVHLRQRINERKMVQWKVAYAAIGYGIQHAVILTSESFEWPNAATRMSSRR